MTEQNKQILFKDLCARVPYNTIVKVDNGRLHEDVELTPYHLACFNIWSIVPYLRPLSSMSIEEIDKYIRLRHKDCIDVERPAHCCKNSITAVVVTLTSRERVRYWYNDMVSVDTIDFLNARHLDWRGLLPIGIALEAQEGMYETKTE